MVDLHPHRKVWLFLQWLKRRHANDLLPDVSIGNYCTKRRMVLRWSTLLANNLQVLRYMKYWALFLSEGNLLESRCTAERTVLHRT